MGNKVSSRKMMTTGPGLLLGPNPLLLHSDRYRPASQEQDRQEACFPKVFVKWTLHCLTGDIVQLFVFEDPSKLMPKKSPRAPLSHGRPCSILGQLPRGSWRRPVPVILSIPLITSVGCQSVRATEAKSRALKNCSIFISLQDALRIRTGL